MASDDDPMVSDKREMKKGLGISGLWLGFVVGMIHQISMYLYLIHKTNWKRASYEALKRMKSEAKSGNRSHIFRMADDLSNFSFSQSFIDQVSFAGVPRSHIMQGGHERSFTFDQE